jgi:succinyl-CoA synthetase beta subunit
MKIHEYQAKQILSGFGVPVPRGEVAETAEQAEEIAAKLGGRVVVKAQIHAGGRGKGGGVKLAASPAEAREIAARMLGMKLVTHQTGPEGREVRRVLVEETLPIRQELYLGLVLDRNQARPVFMASAAGGVEIEDVAAKTPELILKEPILPGFGLQPYQARRLAFGLGLPADLIRQAVQVMMALARAYVEIDAALAEINPFILTEDERLVALDAKINFDDNALGRHKDFLVMRDLNEEEPLEIEAGRYELNYIKLDGNVGCMVNGAGLAMATMDIIKYAGGNPANFLDVGGGASAEQVTHAFQILLSDKNVRAVLINIFGGILRCDRLAAGVVEAARSTRLSIPVVVRMEGTNVEQGRQILRDSGLNFIVAADMKDAAEKVVAAAAQRG